MGAHIAGYALLTGGIYNFGALTVDGTTTITDNFAYDIGGGIYNEADITILPPATVTGNTPDDCYGC